MAGKVTVNFDAVIRAVRVAGPEKTGPLYETVVAKMQELGMQPDLTLAVNVAPDGSDQINIAGPIRWVQSIKWGHAHKEDRRQLKILHATLEAKRIK